MDAVSDTTTDIGEKGRWCCSTCVIPLSHQVQHLKPQNGLIGKMNGRSALADVVLAIPVEPPPGNEQTLDCFPDRHAQVNRAGPPVIDQAYQARNKGIAGLRIQRWKETDAEQLPLCILRNGRWLDMAKQLHQLVLVGFCQTPSQPPLLNTSNGEFS